MAKYGKKAQDKVGRAMRERKQGTLRSGSGRKVTSRKQAIAIGLSEARREGGKVPRQRASKRASSKKSARTTRSTTRRSTSRKTSRTRSARKK